MLAFLIRKHYLIWDWRFGGAFIVRLLLCLCIKVQFCRSLSFVVHLQQSIGCGIATGVGCVPQGIMTLGFLKYGIMCIMAAGPVNRKLSAFVCYLLLYIPYNAFLSILHVRF